MDPNEPTRARVERAQREVARLRVTSAELAVARSSGLLLPFQISTALATGAFAFGCACLLARMLALGDVHAEEAAVAAQHRREMATLVADANACAADRGALQGRITVCEERLSRWPSASGAGQ